MGVAVVLLEISKVLYCKMRKIIEQSMLFKLFANIINSGCITNLLVGTVLLKSGQ